MRKFKIIQAMKMMESKGKLVCGFCGCVMGVKQVNDVEIEGLRMKFENYSVHAECGHNVYFKFSIN